MSSFAEKLAFFNQKAKKEETKEKTKNDKPPKPIIQNPKIKNIVNNSNISEIKKSPIEIKNEVDKPKLIEGSELISNENPELKIYKYPNIKFDKNTKDNCKVLLFIGDNPEQFINSFINIYSGVNYEDNFRYKIFSDNNSYSIHNIKKGTSKYNLIIISITSSIENGEFMKYIYDIFNIKTMPKKINSIFITLEEKSQLLNKGMITFLSFINLSNKEAMENKINILFSKEDSNNVFNEENNNFVFDNYLNKALTSLFKPDFKYINNNIIYDKKPENEDQWKKLNEQITDIKEKIIGKSKSLTMDKERESFFATFLNNNDKKFKQIIKIFEKLKKNEQIILINFLLNCNINYENSSLILFLYNKIIENRIEITIDNKEIKLVNNTNISNSLNVFSKIKFKNLKYVFCKDCNLNDKSLLMIKKLFSNNLIELDLSKNQFSDMTIFNNEDNLINLYKLDLSYNKIKNIDSLIYCKI